MPQTMVSGPKPVTFGDIHALSIGCTDASGNVATQTVAVTVPFDGKK